MKPSAAEKAGLFILLPAFSPLLDVSATSTIRFTPCLPHSRTIGSVYARRNSSVVSLKSICFFAEFDPKMPMEVSPLAAHVDCLCVLFIFFYCA